MRFPYKIVFTFFYCSPWNTRNMSSYLIKLEKQNYSPAIKIYVGCPWKAFGNCKPDTWQQPDICCSNCKACKTRSSKWLRMFLEMFLIFKPYTAQVWPAEDHPTPAFAKLCPTDWIKRNASSAIQTVSSTYYSVTLLTRRLPDLNQVTLYSRICSEIWVQSLLWQ